MSWVDYRTCEACHYSQITILKDQKCFCRKLMYDVKMQPDHCEYAEKLIQGCLNHDQYRNLDMVDRVFIIMFTNDELMLAHALQDEKNGYLRNKIIKKLNGLKEGV
jgi:hypothetical protein